MRLSPRLLLMVSLISPVLQAARNPLQEMLMGFDPKVQQEKRNALETAVSKNPTDIEGWLQLSQFSYETEEPEQTLEILAKAIKSVSRPAIFWRFTAQIHIDDAKSGPKSFQRPNCYRKRKTPSPLDDKTFKQQSLESALTALDKVIGFGGDSTEEATRTRAQVLMSLERWPEAEKQAAALLKAVWNDKDAALQAFCVLQQERKEEALKLVVEALEKAPHSSDLHTVKSRIHEAFGDKEAQAKEEAIFGFYERLMTDSKLEYSPEAAASLAKLFGTKPETSGMFGGDRLNDQIKEEIERLAKQETEESSELLATLAFSHFAHGELEDRAFEILGQRKDTGRIRRILNNARSGCTVAGCLNQMIPLRMEGTFEVLRDMLDKDGGMFPMYIVAKMGRLGDPRAGLVLRDYTKTKESAFFEDALVTLGSFDSPETRAHLEKWLNDKDAAPFAAAGLYHITKEPKYLKPIKKALGKLSTWAARPIALSLEGTKDKEAQQILKAYDERVAKEEQEQAAKRAKEEKERSKRAKTKAN